MHKLTEKQFINIMNNVTNKHHQYLTLHPKWLGNVSHVRGTCMGPFSFLAQTFCQILWKCTEPQDDDLKSYMQDCVGVITGNRDYTQRKVVLEIITLKQFLELFEEILNVYEKSHYRGKPGSEEELAFQLIATVLCDVLKEHLPAGHVKEHLNISLR